MCHPARALAAIRALNWVNDNPFRVSSGVILLDLLEGSPSSGLPNVKINNHRLRKSRLSPTNFIGYLMKSQWFFPPSAESLTRHVPGPGAPALQQDLEAHGVIQGRLPSVPRGKRREVILGKVGRVQVEVALYMGFKWV